MLCVKHLQKQTLFLEVFILNLSIIATFDSPHDAKIAIDCLKSKIEILSSSYDSAKTNEPSFPILPPLHSSIDADTVEKTFGTLHSPLVTHLAQHHGDTKIKLILSEKDSDDAKSILRKKKAKSIVIETNRD